MNHTLHRIREFLSYQQRAQTKYYIHSPFVYQFYLHILETNPSTETKSIRELRHKLFQNYNKILIDDKGAHPGQKNVRVSSLARRASMPERYGKILYNLVKYFQPKLLIELGTCLGISSAYMASAAPGASLVTIEGAEVLAGIAQNNLNRLHLTNVRIQTGDFDQQLPEILKNLAGFDLAFVDGNHRYRPTMKYFELLIAHARPGCILIFDDIYWSPEMTSAWQEIKKDKRIKLTIDLWRFGLAFLNSDKLSKEDFTLRY